LGYCVTIGNRFSALGAIAISLLAGSGYSYAAAPLNEITRVTSHLVGITASLTTEPVKSTPATSSFDKSRLERTATGSDSEYSSSNFQASTLFSDPTTAAGIGYIWQVSKSLYLSPWAAAHVLGGDVLHFPESHRSPSDPVEANPEFSIRLGVIF
jgi:hypothetical protein